MAERKFSIQFLKQIAILVREDINTSQPIADFDALIGLIEKKATRFEQFIGKDGKLSLDPIEDKTGGFLGGPSPWPYDESYNTDGSTRYRHWLQDYNDLLEITSLIGDDVKFTRKDQSGWAEAGALFGIGSKWALDTTTLKQDFQGSNRDFKFQEFRQGLLAEYADVGTTLDRLYGTGLALTDVGGKQVSHDLIEQLLMGGIETDVEHLIQHYMAENSLFYSSEVLEGDHIDSLILLVEDLYTYQDARARQEIGELEGADLTAYAAELQEQYDAYKANENAPNALDADIDRALIARIQQNLGKVTETIAYEENTQVLRIASAEAEEIKRTSANNALGTTLDGIDFGNKWKLAGISDVDKEVVTELPSALWDTLVANPNEFLAGGEDYSLSAEQVRAYLEFKKEDIETAWELANGDEEFDERFDTWFSDKYTDDLRIQIHNNDPTIYGGGRLDFILDELITEYVQDIPILNNMRGTVSDLIKDAVRTLRAQGSTSTRQLTKTEAFEELISGKHPGIDTGLIKRAYISDLIYSLQGGSEFVEALNASDIDLYAYIDEAGSLTNPTQWLQGIVNAAVLDNPDVLPGVGPNFVEDDVIAFTTMASTLLAGDPDFENGGLALRNAMRESLINQFRTEYGSSNIQDADPIVFTNVYNRLGDNFAENQLREIIRRALPAGEAGAESPASRMIESLEKSAENKEITFVEAYQELGIDKTLDRGEVFSAALFEAFEALELGPSKEELAELGLREQFEGFSEQLIQNALSNIQSYIAGNYPDEDLSDVLSGIYKWDDVTSSVISSRDTVEAYASQMLQMTENIWAGGDEKNRELLLAIAKSYSTAEDDSGVRTFMRQFPDLMGMTPNVMAVEIEENLGRYTMAGADTTVIDELMVDLGIVKSIEEASQLRQQEQVAMDLLKSEVEAGYRERIKDIDPSLFRGTLAKIEDMIYQKGWTFTEAMVNKELIGAIDLKISEIEDDFALQEELEEYQEDKDRLDLEGKAGALRAQALQQKAQELELDAMQTRIDFESTDIAKNLRQLQEGQALRSEFGSTFDAEFQRQAYGSLSGTGAGMVFSDVSARLRADYTNQALARAGVQQAGDIGFYGAKDTAVAFVGPEGETAEFSPQSFISGLGEDYFRQQLRESQLRRRPVRSGVARDITRQTQGPQFTPNRI